MRVGIIGNYGHDNNGDEAILQGLIEQLTSRLQIDHQNIVIFSNDPQNTHKRYGIQAVPLIHKKKSLLLSVFTTLRESSEVMKDLDVIIIGGGGLLMDMYKRDAPLYSTLALLARLTKCKVIIYGVGAGPINTNVGKFFIKMMTKVASSISVRDEQSKQLLQQIGVKKRVKVIADPAFQLQTSNVKVCSEKIKKIGVTVVPYFCESYWPLSDKQIYENYIKAMAKNLDELIRNIGVEITLFSTKYPQDVFVSHEIFSLMKEQQSTQVVIDNLHPTKLLSLCEEQDLIIGTRLHSLIISVAAETPVIGIGYHKKVKSFMTNIDKQENYIDISQLEKDNQLQAIVEKITYQWTLEQQDFKGIAQQQRSLVLRGIQQLQDIIH